MRKPPAKATYAIRPEHINILNEASENTLTRKRGGLYISGRGILNTR